MAKYAMQSGREVKKLRKTVAEDGATIEYQTSGRDFWVTLPNGEEKQCQLGTNEKNELDHPWWRAVRAARKAV